MFQITQTKTETIVFRHFVDPNQNANVSEFNNFNNQAANENNGIKIEPRRTYDRTCKNKWSNDPAKTPTASELSLENISSTARLPQQALFQQIFERNNEINNTTPKRVRMQLRKNFCTQLKALKTELLVMGSPKMNKNPILPNSSVSKDMGNKIRNQEAILRIYTNSQRNPRKARKNNFTPEKPLDDTPKLHQFIPKNCSQLKIAGSKLKNHELRSLSKICVEDSKQKNITSESEKQFEKFENSSDTTVEINSKENDGVMMDGMKNSRIGIRPCRVVLKRLKNVKEAITAKNLQEEFNERKHNLKLTKKEEDKEIIAKNVQTDKLKFDSEKCAEKSEEKVSVLLDNAKQTKETNFERKNQCEVKETKETEKQAKKDAPLSPKNTQNTEKLEHEKRNKKIQLSQDLESNERSNKNDIIDEKCTKSIEKKAGIEIEKQQNIFIPKANIKLNNQTKNFKKSSKEKKNFKLKSFIGHPSNDEQKDIETNKSVCQIEENSISSMKKDGRIKSVNTQKLSIQNEKDRSVLINEKNLDPIGSGSSKENEVVKQNQEKQLVEKKSDNNKDNQIENCNVNNFKDDLESKCSKVSKKIQLEDYLKRYKENKKNSSDKNERKLNEEEPNVMDIIFKEQSKKIIRPKTGPKKPNELSKKSKDNKKDEQQKHKKSNKKRLSMDSHKKEGSQSTKTPIQDEKKNEPLISKNLQSIFSHLKKPNDSVSLEKNYPKNTENENENSLKKFQTTKSKWLESIKNSTLIQSHLSVTNPKSADAAIKEYNNRKFSLDLNETAKKITTQKRQLEIDKEDNNKNNPIFREGLFKIPRLSEQSLSLMLKNPFNLEVQKSQITTLSSSDRFLKDLTVEKEFASTKLDGNINNKDKTENDSRQNYLKQSLNWENAYNSTPNTNKKCIPSATAGIPYRNPFKDDVPSDKYNQLSRKTQISVRTNYEDSGYYDISSVESLHCDENKSTSLTSKYSSGFASVSNVELTPEDIHDWDEEFMDMQFNQKSNENTNILKKQKQSRSPVFKSTQAPKNLVPSENVSNNNIFEERDPRMKPKTFVSFYSYENRCMHYMPWKLIKVELPPVEVNKPDGLELLLLNTTYNDSRLDKYRNLIPSITRKSFHQKLNEQNRLILLKSLHQALSYQKLRDIDKQYVSKLLLFKLMRYLNFYHQRCEEEISEIKFDLDSIKNSQEIKRALDILNLTVNEKGEIIVKCNAITNHGHQQMHNILAHGSIHETECLHHNAANRSFFQSKPIFRNQLHNNNNNNNALDNRDCQGRQSLGNMHSVRA